MEQPGRRNGRSPSGPQPSDSDSANDEGDSTLRCTGRKAAVRKASGSSSAATRPRLREPAAVALREPAVVERPSSEMLLAKAKLEAEELERERQFAIAYNRSDPDPLPGSLNKRSQMLATKKLEEEARLARERELAIATNKFDHDPLPGCLGARSRNRRRRGRGAGRGRLQRRVEGRAVAWLPGGRGARRGREQARGRGCEPAARPGLPPSLWRAARDL